MHCEIRQFLEADQYPLPRPEDLMTCLTGGCSFSKLDLSAAYQQMVLDEDSWPYVTINTQRGLYKYLRLPFGVSPAPAVFQKTMNAEYLSRTDCKQGYFECYTLKMVCYFSTVQCAIVHKCANLAHFNALNC